jgi:tetratricopeptide (TPR) repeat protein
LSRNRLLESFLWTPIWVDLRFNLGASGTARKSKSSASDVAIFAHDRLCSGAASGQGRNRTSSLCERGRFASAGVSYWADDPNEALVAVMNAFVEAKLDAARGNSESALKHWRRAIEAQDKLNYTEPPDWYYPVRESLGAALLAGGCAEEAEQVLRGDLRRNPRNPRSLFGLEKSLGAQHLENDAGWVAREFQRAWKNADSRLKIGDLY